MNYILTGIALIAVTAAIFWYVKPRPERSFKFIKHPKFEPYIAVLFLSGFAFGVILIFVGATGG